MLFLYDTTLRDGCQRAGLSLSLDDKLKITRKLDRLGVHYIEGGWPASNPKDLEYFRRVKELELAVSRVAAFGSTRRPGCLPEDDPSLLGILEIGAPVATLFGKSWGLHVKEALGTTLDENLSMIHSSVRFLKSQGLEVIYDAEHFFDGYKSDAGYALETLRAAAEGGADWLVLCDTNGGTLPLDLKGIVEDVRARLGVPLGIHAHNDAGMAAANSVVAVQAGAKMVHGTINGYGERCGNADLCTLIPTFKLKLGHDCVSDEALAQLTRLSRYVSEIANLAHDDSAPYVGHNAFAHKGGVHVSAVGKRPETYEHVDPALVGNARRVLVSELSGQSALLYKDRESGLGILSRGEEARRVLERIKALEHEGYQFDGAEASFQLLTRKTLNSYNPCFELEGFRVMVEKHEDGGLHCEATIKVRIGGRVVHTAAEGNGPVNALDNALRKALEEVYPSLKAIKLVDYKVRVLDGNDGTGAKVRVLIESSDTRRSWGTVGVSTNIIEASWQALVDSLEYALLSEEESGPS